jgi:RNA polymerase sigma-70 factor (ECF subfamily)
MQNKNIEDIAESLYQYLATKDIIYLESFYNRLYPLAYKISFLITKNAADADDVAQTSFYTVFNQLETCQALKVKNNEKVRSWFLSIVYNHSKVVLRTRRRNKNKENGQKDNQIQKDQKPTMNKYLETQMKSAIDSLDEKYRIPIILKYQEGLNSSEMSEILKVNEVTLRVRIKRGLEKVRVLLVKDQNEFEKLLPSISLISFVNYSTDNQLPKYANKDLINSKPYVESRRNKSISMPFVSATIILTCLAVFFAYNIFSKPNQNIIVNKKNILSKKDLVFDVPQKVLWDLTKGNFEGIKVIKGNWDFKDDGMVTTDMKEPSGTLISLPIKTSKYFKVKFIGKIEFNQKSEAPPYVAEGVHFKNKSLLDQELIYKKELIESISLKDVKKEFGVFVYNFEFTIYFTKHYNSTRFMNNEISLISKINEDEIYDDTGIFLRDVKVQKMEYESISEQNELALENEINKILKIYGSLPP